MSSPGIYVSVPFCAQKCTYCNFRSDVFPQALRAKYVRFLAEELRLAEVPAASTIYFGGGSPSLLDPAEFSALTASLPVRDCEEATIEVAPGEATPERVAAWVTAGINRVSFGVQSLVADVARAAGRKHDIQTVRTEIDRLRAAGIRNVSLDLIAGLARQSFATWCRTLARVESLDVNHVSVYMLEKDDDSRLGRELRSGGSLYGAPEVPGEDETLDFYLFAAERLAALGYERYEVSNFARPGMRSLHNLKYWRMQPYYGFGSDAHSFNGRERWSMVPTAPEYVRRMAAGLSPRATFERLDGNRLLEDRVLTGLRTREGIRLGPREWRTVEPRLGWLVERGWLVADRPSLRLTNSGLLFADEAVAELLA